MVTVTQYSGSDTARDCAGARPPPTLQWEEKKKKYCNANWGADWAARTEKSLADCKASCIASPSCSAITVGKYGGVANNCVLCTSTDPSKFGSRGWTTSYELTSGIMGARVKLLSAQAQDLLQLRFDAVRNVATVQIQVYSTTAASKSMVLTELTVLGLREVKKGRVLTGAWDDKWVHGHDQGQAGVARYADQWNTGAVSPLSSLNSNWLVLCGQNAAPNLFLANGRSVGVTAGGIGNGETLRINPIGGTEGSDFNVAEVVTWSRALTTSEMKGASQYLLRQLDTGTPATWKLGHPGHSCSTTCSGSGGCLEAAWWPQSEAAASEISTKMGLSCAYASNSWRYNPSYKDGKCWWASGSDNNNLMNFGSPVKGFIYSTDANNTATGTIAVQAGVTYSLSMELLRNNQNSSHVDSVTFDGQTITTCQPDGADDACTFLNCPTDVKTFTPATSTINVEMAISGPSPRVSKCDCAIPCQEGDASCADKPKDVTCAKTGAAPTGAQAMTAVARFTLTPVPAISQAWPYKATAPPIGGLSWANPASCYTPQQGPTTPCDQAIDDNIKTTFNLQPPTGRVVFDLSTTKLIKGVSLRNRYTSAGSAGIQRFDLEISNDATTWTTVANFTSPPAPPSNAFKIFELNATRQTRYAAVNVKSNYGNSVTTFWDVKFLVAGPFPRCSGYSSAVRRMCPCATISGRMPGPRSLVPPPPPPPPGIITGSSSGISSGSAAAAGGSSGSAAGGGGSGIGSDSGGGGGGGGGSGSGTGSGTGSDSGGGGGVGGFKKGDRVQWNKSDADIPECTVGTVVGFDIGNNEVTVEFPKGTWTFPPANLRAEVSGCSSGSAAAGGGSGSGSDSGGGGGGGGGGSGSGSRSGSGSGSTSSSSQKEAVHDVQLGTLTLSESTIGIVPPSPPFMPNVTIYTATVPFHVQALQIQAVARSALSFVSINNGPATTSTAIATSAPLNVGSNVITATVVILSWDNITSSPATTYTFTVKRTPPSLPSAPTLLRADPLSPDSLNLTWSPPEVWGADELVSYALDEVHTPSPAHHSD